MPLWMLEPHHLPSRDIVNRRLGEPFDGFLKIVERPHLPALVRREHRKEFRAVGVAVSMQDGNTGRAEFFAMHTSNQGWQVRAYDNFEEAIEWFTEPPVDNVAAGQVVR